MLTSLEKQRAQSRIQQIILKPRVYLHLENKSQKTVAFFVEPKDINKRRDSCHVSRKVYVHVFWILPKYPHISLPYMYSFMFIFLLFTFLLIFKIVLQSNGLHYSIRCILNSNFWEFHPWVLHIISTLTFLLSNSSFPLSLPNLWSIIIILHTHTTHTDIHIHYKFIVAQMYMCLGMAIWVWIIYQNVHVWRKLTTHPSIAHSSFFSPTVLVEVRLCEISSTHFDLTTGIVIMKIS